MNKIGFDDNLGLPAGVAESLHCQIEPYHNLSHLIDAFEKHQLSAIFIPAGTLPFVEVDYKIIGQATLGKDRKTKLCSLFCTRVSHAHVISNPTSRGLSAGSNDGERGLDPADKPRDVGAIHKVRNACCSAKNFQFKDLSHLILGRVNPYCTTSYWAPLIFLMKKLPKKTVLQFKEMDTFENMLNQTLSGEIDGAMIWDEVIKKHPDASKKLSILFQYELPTPVIIAHTDIDKMLVQKIPHLFDPDSQAFFNGFTHPNHSELEQFKQDMLAAQTFFKVLSV